MKSICFLTENIWKEARGGAEFQVELQKQYLIDHGYKVNHIYLTHKSGEHHDYDNEHRVTRNNRWIDRFFGDCRLQYFRHIYEQLLHVRPDVVIHRDLSSLALPAIQYAKQFRAKVFIQLAHQKDVEPLVLSIMKNPLAGYFERRARKTVLLAADVILAQAQYQNELLLQKFGRESHHIMRNAHPIDLRISQAKEIKSGDFVVCWIANFKEWKRPELFVELAESLATRPSIKFVMIGRMKNSNWGRALLARIEKCTNISYLGELPIQDVNCQLSQSHAFVNTSTAEGFPNTFIQAWLSGVPVLSLNVDPDGCLAEHGLGKRCAEVTELARAICEMEADRDATVALGEKCRNYAVQTHSTQNFDILRKLIENDAAR